MRLALLTLAVAWTAAPAAVGPAHAQNAGSRSVFDEGTGNRALAMGGAFAAIADDATSLIWNPGGLGRVPRFQLQAGQSGDRQLGVQEGWAVAAIPNYRWGVIAGAFRYLGVGDLDLRDDRNFPVGSAARNTQTEMIFGYGHRVGDSFGVGATFKARRQTLADFSDTGFGVDAGVTGYPAAAFGIEQGWLSDLSIGLAVSNLVRPEQRLDRESVSDPTILRGGVALRGRFGAMQNILLSADLESPEQLAPTVHLGLEFQPFPEFALRAGMNGGTLTAGSGLRWHGVQLDYAFEDREFEQLHHVGLAFAFGRTVNESREIARGREEEKIQARLEEGFRQRQTDQVEGLVSRARELRGRGDFAGAIDLLTAASTLDTARADLAPLVAGSHLGLAAGLEAAGDYSGAAISYGEALRVAPSDTAAAAGRARCKEQSDRRAQRSEETRRLYAEALEAFGADDLALARARLRKVLELEPDDRDAAALLRRTDDTIGRRAQGLLREARLSLDSGRPAQAAKLADRVAALDPTADGLPALRTAMARSRARAVEDSIFAVRAHATAAPAAPSISAKEIEMLYQRGLAAMQAKRSDDALHCWEIVWSANPRYSRVVELLEREYLTRGMEAFAAGRIEDAIAFWRNAQRVDPADPRAPGYIEQAQKRMSRTHEILGSKD